MSVDLQNHVRSLIEFTVARLGFDLVAVEWMGGSHGRVLRVSIGSPKGITAEDCVQLSRRITPIIDADDPVSGNYRLEVSSPGLHRPIQTLEDFERLAGYQAKIRMEEGLSRRNFMGTLVGVDEDEIILCVDGVDTRLSYFAIERAHLKLDLEEYQQLEQQLYGDTIAKEVGGD